MPDRKGAAGVLLRFTDCSDIVAISATRVRQMVKFMNYRDLRNTPSAVWEALETDEAVALVANGEPRAIMLGIEPDDLETMLQVVRRVRAQMALSRIRASAADRNVDQLTAEDIAAEIVEARAQRKRLAKRRKS
jgi:hypothetical protein